MIQIVSATEAKQHHCGAILRRLRLRHAELVVEMGLNSHRELRTRLSESWLCRTWFLDGKIAALAGVAGPRLAHQGHFWMAVSDDALRRPTLIVREGRKFLAEAMDNHESLITTVLLEDEPAKRFAAFFGFHAIGVPRRLAVVAVGTASGGG